VRLTKEYQVPEWRYSYYFSEYIYANRKGLNRIFPIHQDLQFIVSNEGVDNGCLQLHSSSPSLL